MLKDQKELLAALNDHGVEYVVIGGHAAIACGVARLTKDLDVLVRPDEKNSEAVYAALGAFGAPLESLAPNDFRDSPDSIFQFGAPPNRVDILQSMEGVSFDEAWGDHVDLQIDEAVTAHYVSAAHLIRNKELVERPGDIADVDQLRKIKDLK